MSVSVNARMSVCRCQSSYLSAPCLIKFCSDRTGGRQAHSHAHAHTHTHTHTRTHTRPHTHTRQDVVQVNNVGQLVEQPRQTSLTHYTFPRVRCLYVSLPLSPSLSLAPPLLARSKQIGISTRWAKFWAPPSPNADPSILGCLAKLFTSRLAIIQLYADAKGHFK